MHPIFLQEMMRMHIYCVHTPTFQKVYPFMLPVSRCVLRRNADQNRKVSGFTRATWRTQSKAAFPGISWKFGTEGGY